MHYTSSVTLINLYSQKTKIIIPWIDDCMHGRHSTRAESMDKQKVICDENYGDDDHIIEQAEVLSSQKYSSQRLT